MQNIVFDNHGVELFGAIVTLLALTFTNIKRTDKRLEKDEKKEYKTLKMIDLSTHKENEYSTMGINV